MKLYIVEKIWSGNILLPRAKGFPNRYKNYTYRKTIVFFPTIKYYDKISGTSGLYERCSIYENCSRLNDLLISKRRIINRIRKSVANTIRIVFPTIV